MKGTESVALTAGQIVGIYQGLAQKKTENPDEKKAIRRICGAITGHEMFEEMDGGFKFLYVHCPKCKEDVLTEDAGIGGKCVECSTVLVPVPEVWIPMKRKDKSFLWDEIKAELAGASMAREQEIKLVAMALGRIEAFEDLVAEFYEEDEEDGGDDADTAGSGEACSDEGDE